MKQLAILGSPIGQALSPVLHRAAYTALGLDWSYRAIDCTPERLAAFLASLDDSWAGLSLTMPLKPAAVPLLDEVSATVTATGTANTVTVRGGRLLGENTDVDGMLQALLDAGVTQVESACVLGAGATAATALAVLHTLGCRETTVPPAMPSVTLSSPLTSFPPVSPRIPSPSSRSALPELDPSAVLPDENRSAVEFGKSRLPAH